MPADFDFSIALRPDPALEKWNRMSPAIESLKPPDIPPLDARIDCLGSRHVKDVTNTEAQISTKNGGDTSDGHRELPSFRSCTPSSFLPSSDIPLQKRM